MTSARGVLPVEARRRAVSELQATGPELFDTWRRSLPVAELRWLAGGMTSTLRASLDASLRELFATPDPATGLAAVHLLQALVLNVLDDDPPA